MRTLRATVRRVLGTLAAVAVATWAGFHPLSSAVAAAQPTAPRSVRAAVNMGGEMRLGQRDLEFYARLLRLTPDQVDAARTLLAGHADTLTAKRNQLQKMREELAEAQQREEWDRERWQKVLEAEMRLAEDAAAAERAFLDDLKTLLKPDQQEHWPRVERAERRAMSVRLLRDAPFMATAVDLVRMVDEQTYEESERALIDPILVRYEADLDLLLVRFQRLFDDLLGDEARMRRIMEEGNIEEMERVVNQIQEIARRIRDLNRRTAREIAELLPPRLGMRLADTFRTRAFPRLGFTAVHASFAIRAIDQVERFEDLSEDQRRSLIALEETHARERRTIFEAAERTIIEWEDTISFRRIMEDPMGSMRSMMETIQELPGKLRAVDERTYNSLRAMLTPVQVERLMPMPSETPAVPAFGGLGENGLGP
jgi:hypothetical protein